MAAPRTAQLFVCTTCRSAAAPEGDDRDGAPRDGQLLFERIVALAAAAGCPVRPVAVTCFANCEQGCTAMVAAPGKWAYLMGRLVPEQAADMLAYATRYAASETGFVRRAERPASLYDTIQARVPAHLLEPATEAES